MGVTISRQDLVDLIALAAVNAAHAAAEDEARARKQSKARELSYVRKAAQAHALAQRLDVLGAQLGEVKQVARQLARPQARQRAGMVAPSMMRRR